MIIKRLISAIAAVMISIGTSLICFADGFGIIQTNVKDQTIDVYISGDIVSDGISCTISDQSAEIVNSGFLSDKNVTTRTTILIDISTSIKRNDGHIRVIELLNNMVENISKNEEYRILTFGDKVDEIQEFTSDRYDLSKAIKGIVFDEQGTILYDAIDTTLPEMKIGTEGEPYFYRTLVISDGEDLSQSYITKEEVYSELQANTYPVDTIFVSTSPVSQAEKDMMTISRISGGTHYSLKNTETIDDICTSLSPDKIYWLRLNIPESLLDGSVRYLNISDKNDVKAEIGVKVPAIIKSSETESTISTSQSESANSSSSLENSEAREERTGISLTTIIIASVALLIIIAAAIVITLLGKKKKHTNSKSNNSGSNPTVMITPNHSQNDQIYGSSPCIRLRNVNDPDMVWELNLTKVLVVGRDATSNIHLTEESVARQQCKIYVNTNGVVTLENLSHSNITELNGTAIKFPQSIKRGDKIKCGRITLMVDYIRFDSTSNIGDNDSLFLGV